MKSIKSSKHIDHATTQDRNSTLIEALYDDPEHHAVVAMYMAKDPNKQS